MGKVKDIGVRASNVVTYDGAEVVVPNSNLIANNLINWTLSDSRKRVEINVGTAYGSNPNEVLEILFKVANNHPDVVKNPEPRALFDGFGDSSLDFRLLFWINFELGLSAKSDVLVGIYNAFAEHNIEIPFPQVDLHVKDIVKEEPIAPIVPQSEEKEIPNDTKKESIIEADDDGSN
jgi:small-conductance mechanosensitive channel